MGPDRLSYDGLVGLAAAIVFSCNSCIGVEIDGSYKWQGGRRVKPMASR